MENCVDNSIEIDSGYCIKTQRDQGTKFILETSKNHVLDFWILHTDPYPTSAAF